MKNGNKIAKKLGGSATVGDYFGEHFQSPGCISKYGNLSKNSQKIAEKSQKIRGCPHWW